MIKFKFSLKNLSKIRIEIKLGITGPARLRISAGPGRYVPRFTGPKIYNPGADVNDVYFGQHALTAI